MAINKINREKVRQRKRLRFKIRMKRSSGKLRLVVDRSLKHISGQIIDDVKGHTLVAASSITGDLTGSATPSSMSKMKLAELVGKTLAERALEKSIKEVIFDRNGYIYHGRVKAFAEGAREGGLKF